MTYYQRAEEAVRIKSLKGKFHLLKKHPPVDKLFPKEWHMFKEGSYDYEYIGAPLGIHDALEVGLDIASR